MKRVISLLITLCLCCLYMFASSENAVAPEIVPATNNANAFIIGDPNDNTLNPTEALPTSTPIPDWSYPIPVSILEDPLDVIRLVNKNNLLDEKYPPDDETHQLMDATVRKSSSSNRLVRKIVNDALQLMFDAAEADGIKLYLHSAYRDYKTQKTVHYNNVKKYGRDNGIVQSPGASEHQMGLGIDVLSKDWIGKTLNERFAQTKEAKWMAENCARFGFIIRYPKDKEDITGIIYEPWHLRFVGVDVALYLTYNDLTLEEFTDEWRAVLYTYTQQGGNSGQVSGAGDFLFTEDGD